MDHQTASETIAVYRSIRAAAASQQAALTDDDLVTFGRLLQERQELLVRVSGTPLTSFSDADRRAAARLIAEILRLDQQTQSTLTHMIAAVRDELLRVRSGRTALQGYYYVGPGARQRGFLDQAS